LLAVALALSLAVTPSATAATVPSGFEDRVLTSGLDFPIAVDWAPDGRMFVAEHAGKVRVVTAAGVLLDEPLLDITDHTNTIIDQGILGMAVDSAFASNHFLWILYVHESNPSDPYAPKTARLSRVVVNNDNTVQNPADPETVVLGRVSTPPCPPPSNTSDCIPSTWTHTVGTVRSAPDGTLWVGAGDAGVPFNAYDERSYSGKILHIDRSGRGLANHPFCPADTDLTHVCTKIFAKGFRNPYRFTLRPGGGLLVGDVGDETRDELDFAVAGKNYGWPCYEGGIHAPRHSADTRCSGPGGEYSKEGTPGASVAPVHDYAVPPEGAAVIGGPTYTATSFPSAYQGDIFFGDYVKGFVKRLELDGQGNVAGVQSFATGWSGVDIALAPWGDLVYADLLGGQVRAISYVPDNRSPIVAARATPTSGQLPLTVQFSSASTSDPDGDPLVYEWDFADGTTSSQANPTHTYTTDGKYTARLTVSDGNGRSASDTVVISAGNSPPTATITAPADGSRYRDGQTVALRGSATDTVDGQLSGSALRWNIELHHGSHIHPFGPFTGASTSFLATDDHDADSHYVVKLTATNSRGLSDTASATIHPETIRLTLDSLPLGAPLTYSGTSLRAPVTRDAAIGYRTSISGAERFFKEDGRTYQFVLWTDNGARQHNITIPATDKRITAVYGEDKAAGRATTASSQVAGQESGKAVDGSSTTRWTSAAASSQWWQVDLGGVRSVNQLWLEWSSTFASQYRIETSTDGVDFSTAASASITGPGLRATSFSTRSARYVRVIGDQGATVGGMSFAEARVFGPEDGFPHEDKAAGRATSASSAASPHASANAVDGSSSTRWLSAPTSSQWWQVDLGCVRSVDRLALNWHNEFAPEYRIGTSADGVSFTTVAEVSVTRSGWETAAFPARGARYVRVTGVKRSGFGGISFWDARVFGPADAGCNAGLPPVAAPDPALPADPLPALAPSLGSPLPSGGKVVPVRVSRREVAVDQRGIAAIRLRCLARVRCRGTLTVSGPARIRRSVTRWRALGRARFSIASKRSKVVRVRLSRTGRLRVLRAGRLRCRASVATRATGARMVLSSPLVLKARRRPA
jgi:glucose/arabinose dehydrogenase